MRPIHGFSPTVTAVHSAQTRDGIELLDADPGATFDTGQPVP